jgi:hypothetical protein
MIYPARALLAAKTSSALTVVILDVPFVLLNPSINKTGVK